MVRKPGWVLEKYTRICLFVLCEQAGWLRLRRCSLMSRHDTPEHTQTHTYTHKNTRVVRTARILLLSELSVLFLPTFTSAYCWKSYCEAQCCRLLANLDNNNISHRATLVGWTANSQWKHRLFILGAPVFQFTVSKWRHCGCENHQALKHQVASFPYKVTLFYLL